MSDKEGVERDEEEVDRSCDSLAANVSATGVPSIDTSVEEEPINMVINPADILSSAPEDEDKQDEEQSRDAEKQNELGCSPDEPVQDFWAYADFKLKLDLMLQFNTVTGEAALLGVDNIDINNGGFQETEKRISDISGYTAGSSSAASACSAAYSNPPKGHQRMSDATLMTSSSLSAQETRILQPQNLLSRKRLSYLREKYWNHELLYYVIDYIDQIVTQVPREEEQSLSQPMQVKRSSRRLLVKNPKRRKVGELIEMQAGAKTVFAKATKTSNKYFPARAWSALENGDYMIEFYNNETKKVSKRYVYDEFQDTTGEKKVLFLRPNKFGRRIAIPGLVANMKYVDDELLCDLMTDEGDIDAVHISYLYLTDDIVNELDPSRKQTLILPIKKSKRCFTETNPDAEVELAADAEPEQKSSSVHILGTEEEGAIDSGLEPVTDTEPDTTTQTGVPDHEAALAASRRHQPYPSSASSSDDSDPLQPPLEAAEGCDPEKKFYAPFRDMYIKSKADEPNHKNCEMLGPLEAGEWFKDMFFILTCSKYCLSVEKQEMVSDDENYVFSRVPFVFNHLVAQIKLAGGRIYENYADVPKERLKALLVVAPKPCLTARYIECMSHNVKIVCHEWIVNCCKAKAIVPHQELPLGWSEEAKRFISNFERTNTEPFANIVVRVTSRSRDNCFFDFWSRVMRVGGANVRPTRRSRYGKDLVIIDSGYHFAELPIAVTPTWVIQCIIHGELKIVSAHEDYEYPLF